jgi:hypothetical protein
MEHMTEDELENYFRRKAINFVIENPGRTLHLALIKQLRFWSPIPNFSEYRNLKYGAVSFLSYAPLLILAVWLVLSEKEKRKDFALLCFPILFFALIHTIFLGSLRYRIPVDPFIIILAAGKISLISKN